MIARLGEVADPGAVVIEENLLGIGTVEKYLGQFQSPLNGTGSDAMSASQMFSLRRRDRGKR
jgi:hypothetical protein